MCLRTDHPVARWKSAVTFTMADPEKDGVKTGQMRNGQQADEKRLYITGYHGNTNQDHNQISLSNH